jgi:phosphoribosylaminoimidazole-succinocarboxamide synthase
MDIIFFTSGSGTTAKYIANKLFAQNASSITVNGFIYEPNVIMKATIQEMQDKFPSVKMQQYEVNKVPGTSNEEFHASIWDYLETNYLDGVNSNKSRQKVIVLAGWMHIIPESFIIQCNRHSIKIINLHPTLQYQLIGRDVYPKIWKMYQDGMIRETGCMVHYVSRNLDRGELIHQSVLDLTTMKSFAEYHLAMYGDGTSENPGLEKLCLMEALNKLHNQTMVKQSKPEPMEITPYTFPKVNGLKLKHRGKVRDIYESEYYKNYLFVVTSDRISANDIVISHLPNKGYLLNQINTFWHKLFGLDQLICSTGGNLMIIRKMKAIPLEIIVRRRITGSLWKLYSQENIREVNGYQLKDGLSEGDLFDEPIVTPTTKGEHDIPITFNEITQLGILSKSEMEVVRDKSIALFKLGEKYMKNFGIEMIDTKFEFGFDSDGCIEFIDEIFTPDSSRFIVDGKRMDKDILRRWAKENELEILSYPPGSDGCRGVKLPSDVKQRLVSNYSEFLDRLQADQIVCRNLGDETDEAEYNPAKAAQIYDSLTRLSRVVIILAGSKSDYVHVEKIREELTKQNILTFVYYSSAHKNTQTVMEILQAFETRTRSNIVYVTVAGMSNALSGVVAANVSRPVIACPPFSDKGDYQVNIHSTIQMPSAVPVACILRPDNVAAFCSRVFAIC